MSLFVSVFTNPRFHNDTLLDILAVACGSLMPTLIITIILTARHSLELYSNSTFQHALASPDHSKYFNNYGIV